VIERKLFSEAHSGVRISAKSPSSRLHLIVRARSVTLENAELFELYALQRVHGGWGRRAIITSVANYGRPRPGQALVELSMAETGTVLLPT
jgi:hypothetical protein